MILNKIGMRLSKVIDLLDAASAVVTHVEGDPVLQHTLAVYGFSATQLHDGKALLRSLELKWAIQSQLASERSALSQQINVSLLATRDQFKEHARLTLAAFWQDVALIRALRIEPIATRRWECVRQAAYFYQVFGESENYRWKDSVSPQKSYSKRRPL